MDEIKEGEYVRINSDFRVVCIGIGKVTKIAQETIYVKMNLDLPISFKKEDIKKHSFNIIDLIEEGDYVNGRLILQVDYKMKRICLLVTFLDTMSMSNVIWIDSQDIKSIVTKEQFKSVEYEV